MEPLRWIFWLNSHPSLFSSANWQFHGTGGNFPHACTHVSFGVRAVFSQQLAIYKIWRPWGCFLSLVQFFFSCSPAALLSCHRTQGISLKYSSSQQEGRKQQRRRWRRHAVKNPLLLAARSKQIIKDAVKIAAAAVAEEWALEWRAVN